MLSEIPVLGSTKIVVRHKAGDVRATGLVHGVRRIPGATVLYFSVGLPAGSPKVLWSSVSNNLDATALPGRGLGTQQLVDVAGSRVYSVLADAGDKGLASPAEAWPGDSGQFYVMYQLLPELPATLTVVDVLIGNNDVIQDVPVSDGLMEPAVPQAGPLKLGEGWPKIDPAMLSSSVRPQDSIASLEIESSDLERSVVKRSRSGSVSVDLAADVLFAVDSATLSAAATGKIQVAADEINSRAAAGKVQVVGHTDNSGTSAHNLDLSRRRAQAVQKALGPLVTVAGVSFVVDGRGELEPVTKNDTSAGRKLNRRVSVVFTPKEAK